MIITDFMLGKKAIKFKIKFTLNIYIYNTNEQYYFRVGILIKFVKIIDIFENFFCNKSLDICIIMCIKLNQNLR